jgi:hypothetical protein
MKDFLDRGYSYSMMESGKFSCPAGSRPYTRIWEEAGGLIELHRDQTWEGKLTNNPLQRRKNKSAKQIRS